MAIDGFMRDSYLDLAGPGSSLSVNLLPCFGRSVTDQIANLRGASSDKDLNFRLPAGAQSGQHPPATIDPAAQFLACTGPVELIDAPSQRRCL